MKPMLDAAMLGFATGFYVQWYVAALGAASEQKAKHGGKGCSRLTRHCSNRVFEESFVVELIVLNHVHHTEVELPEQVSKEFGAVPLPKLNEARPLLKP